MLIKNLNINKAYL